MKEIAADIIKKELNQAGITIEKIILYGSRVRGDFKQDSDWDFFVIIDKDLDFNQKWKIIKSIKRKLAMQKIPNDIILNSQSQVERYKNDVGRITYYAMKEGIAI